MSAKNRRYLIHLLDEVIAIAASSSANVPQTENHAFEAWFTGSGSEVVVFDVEGGLSGGRWFQMERLTFSAGQITADEGMFIINNTLVNRVRVVPVTLTNVTAFSVDYAPGRKNPE